jgi:hypothetical protein
MSRINGEYKITIQGKEYILCFDWKALSEVEAAHGDTPNLFNSKVVASVASIGLIRNHPELTTGRIIELSPPLIPFINDVQKALNWAYFGEDSFPGIPEKKNLFKIIMEGSFLPLNRLFRMG